VFAWATLRSAFLHPPIADRGTRVAVRRPTVALVVSAGLSVPFCVGLVAMPPILTRGEAREAMVVRSVTRGDWILPRREGRVPSKPPLFHWIAAVPARAFGVSDVSLRLPSALAAWVLLLATMGLGAQMGGRRVGWLACGILLCMPDVWRAALEARVDMVFAGCVCLSLAGGHRWVRRGGRAALVQCWFAGAAAVLAKGPAGAVLPATILWAWTTLAPPREARPLWSTPLAVGAASVVLGWYAAAWRIGGDAFVEVQLLHENVDRALGLHGFAHHRARDPLKLVRAFAVHLAPWNLAVVASAARWWRRRRPPSDVVFLHLWWIVVLATFTLAAGKRSIYLLPLHPAVALLSARLLAPRVPSRVQPAAPATLALIALAVAALTLRSAWVDAGEARPLSDFAHRVASQVPAAAGVQAAWSLSENDRLVLAYLLDRDVPRAGAERPEAEYVVAALPVGRKLAALCAPVARGSSARHSALALLRCTACRAPG
jgi:4-amino-4-deoxy-L-arabinose transferase-like glycosyltransferase